MLSVSKASCGTIQVSTEQRQVGMRKGSKTVNSTHDHGGLLVAGPGQDCLHWEEWRQWQDPVEAAWAGNVSAVSCALW